MYKVTFFFGNSQFWFACEVGLALNEFDANRKALRHAASHGHNLAAITSTEVLAI